MNYSLFMDVSGDVDAAFAAENNIRFVPMEYTIGEELHTSTAPETPEFMKRFYDGQRAGDLTQTTQINPYNYEHFFAPYLEKGESVLYLSLSSGLSNTYNSAVIAAESLKEKYPDAELVPVDSLSATAGIGMLAEHAVKNMKAGMDLHENAEDLKAYIPRLDLTFMVQDLTYLHRGGRVSATTMIVANTLNIKPILKIDEKGALVTINKKRGNKPAMNLLLDYFDKEREPGSEEPIYIVDSDSPELYDYLYEEVRRRCPNAPIRHTSLSPVIGAHTGPGLAAVCHVTAAK